MIGRSTALNTASMRGSFSLAQLCICGLVFLVAIGLFTLPHLFPRKIGTGYILLSTLMMGVMLIVWRRQILTPRQVLFLSLLLTLALFFILPYTSNDTERYIWDGAVVISGFDPYVIAPDNPLVADLRDIWATPEEHAAYQTLYPPGALFLFSICALAGPVYAIWVWKLLTTLALCGSLIIGLKLLESREASRHFALLALCPLLIFETQIGGHLDIFSVLGVLAALLALEKDKIILAGVLIGIAATTKFLPAVIVGPYLFYLRPQKAVKLFLSAALTWFSIYGAVYLFGYKPLGLLPTFFEKWRGGAPLYPVLDYIRQTLSLTTPVFMGMLLALACSGFLVSAWIARRGEIILAMGLSLSIPLLLSPVLFPWYLLILIPILALKPNMTLLLALFLAPLSYVVLDRWLSEGIWQQPHWPAWVLLFGLLAGLRVIHVTVRRV